MGQRGEAAHLQNIALQLLARLEICNKPWHILGVITAVQRMQAAP